MPAFDKIVVVTQPTALEELLRRYNTRDQARFYLEHNGVPFAGYQAAHDAYHAALIQLKGFLPAGSRVQFLDRGFLPTFLFGPNDLVVALGRDGLVVNIAKYLDGQPLVGLNPDPRRIDGVLLKYPVGATGVVLEHVLHGWYTATGVTMAKATTNAGQTLYAVNDLFVGQRTHTSARYRLSVGGREEDQSSSGIIVSTGAGSTGWFRSLLTGAASVVEGFDTASKQTQRVRAAYQFPWDADYLYYCVREPFTSKTSAAELVFGKIAAGETLTITSLMTANGVAFSDGIEADGLDFISGGVLTVGVADKKLQLVTSVGDQGHHHR